MLMTVLAVVIISANSCDILFTQNFSMLLVSSVIPVIDAVLVPQ